MAGHRFQPGDHAQRRRLAAAGWADQHDELLVVDLEVERRNDGDRPEGLGDALQGDAGHGRGAFCDREYGRPPARRRRSEEHTSELQSLMRTSYSVYCLKTT